MTTRLHGWNRLARLGRAHRTSLLLAAPLIALVALDIRLGIAAAAGAAVGLLAGRSPSPVAVARENVSAQSPSAQDRNRLHDIEVETLEGKIADLERRLEGERAHRADLLGVFDATEHEDPDLWLRGIRNHMRIRHEASLPVEAVALGDTFVRCVAAGSLEPGEVTITNSLPVVLASPELVCTVFSSVFDGWRPIGPVTVAGRIDGGMAVVSVHALGLADRARSGHLELTRTGMEHLGGALFVDDDLGVALAIPLAAAAA